MKERVVLINGKVILPDGIKENAVIFVNSGRIEDIKESSEIVNQDEYEKYDAKGKYISPGFVDIHVHGGRGSDFMDVTVEDFDTITKYHASGGTTALLATTASASKKKTLAVLETLKLVKSRGSKGAYIIGAHMEGPYIDYDWKGCHLPSEVRNPDPDEYNAILDKYGHLVRRWTVSLELPGVENFIREIARRGIVVSAGHTGVNYDVVKEALGWGVTHTTHMYCSMSNIVWDKAKRRGGMIESIFLLDELTTEVIADGKHLPGEMLKLTIKNKTTDRVALVSDAMRGSGMPDGEYTFGPKDGQKTIVEDGVAWVPDKHCYASSIAKMIDCVRIMVRTADCSLKDAVKMASIVPAKIIGVEKEFGSIENGRRADIVIFDENFNVDSTWVEGKIIYPE